MEQKRSVRLVLKTSNLVYNAVSNVGTCDEFGTDFTWYNINLRLLLGDLYNQYDYFNLSLISISCSLCYAIDTSATNTTLDTDKENKNVMVKMSGLPFINQTYNQPTGNNSGSVVLAGYSIPITATTANQFYNNASNVCTFNKDQDVCNINITFSRILDDTKPVLDADTENPQFVFIFAITGIDKADNPDRPNYLMKIN